MPVQLYNAVQRAFPPDRDFPFVLRLGVSVLEVLASVLGVPLHVSVLKVPVSMLQVPVSMLEVSVFWDAAAWSVCARGFGVAAWSSLACLGASGSGVGACGFAAGGGWWLTVCVSVVNGGERAAKGEHAVWVWG